MTAPVAQGRSVPANGIDIHYVEAGNGEPLLLLDNAMVSTNPVWRGHPFAYLSHLGILAERFRVVIPDTRGSGRTVHPVGPITHALLADDVVALVGALGLERVSIFGFSDGGEVATIAGIRAPKMVRAIVNLGGYDLFNPDPEAPSLALTRQMLGGAANASEPDYQAISHLAEQSPDFRKLLELMESDHDAAQGSGHWKTVIEQTYPRISQPHGYTADHLSTLNVPTLIVVGDRDPFCTVEEGATLYRALPDGELGVLPGCGHAITPEAVQATVDFLERRLI